MRFVCALKIGTDTLRQLLGRKQRLRFHHRAFAVDPLGFNGIEPGTLVGRKQGKMRTPLFSCLTCWLCSRIQVRTCLLRCHEALS